MDYLRCLECNAVYEAEDLELFKAVDEEEEEEPPRQRQRSNIN